MRALPMMMPHHGERTMKPLQRCREPGSFDTFVQDFRFAASADTHVRRGRVAPFAEPRSRTRLRARHERPGGRRLLGLARSRPVQCVPQALRHNGIGGVGVVIHTRAGRFQDLPGRFRQDRCAAPPTPYPVQQRGGTGRFACPGR